MFGRKAKKIQSLKLDLQAAEIGTSVMERMRDIARTEMAKFQKLYLESEDKLTLALAERDQLVKKLLDLQQEAKNDRAEILRLEGELRAKGIPEGATGPAA